MVGRPGKLQSAFVSAELDPLMWERTALSFYNSGLARAENIEIAPQGGFFNRKGLRDVGAAASDAARLFPFDASDGSSYDLAVSPGQFDVFGEAAVLATVAVPDLTSDMLAKLTTAQQLDTMLLFHEDLATQRVKHFSDTSWAVDAAPYENLPLYDYGGTYTNGVAAVWRCEFIGLTNGSTVFTLDISDEETLAIAYSSTTATLVSNIDAALAALPNLNPGYTVTTSATDKVEITFSGAGNLGDQWAVSAEVANQADAAIISTKITVGVAPGEPIISDDRGWPACGCFYQERLLIGGFKGLPNNWGWSITGDYYNWDQRFTEPNGPEIIPMATAGGEKIVRMIDNRYLLLLTTAAEYWVSDRALQATSSPNIVQASTHGSEAGVPAVDSEGAVLFAHKNRSVISEMRWNLETDYATAPVSLLASHLVKNVADMAQRPGTLSTDGNQLAVVKQDGSALLATFLRDQEPPINAFGRLTSPSATFKAVCRNGRNQIGFLVDRPAGRRLERLEEGLLLDEAQDFDFTGSPQATITGLTRFDARQVWCIGDGDVFGPFTVAASAITLPRAVSFATVGSWMAAAVDTLPMGREIGPGLVLKRRARIHSVVLSLLDTTSVAIGTNGGPLHEIDLYRYGMAADVPELEAGFTGEIKINGLTGFRDAPYVTVSQVRPGRLTVRSITLEAQL